MAGSICGYQERNGIEVEDDVSGSDNASALKEEQRRRDSEQTEWKASDLRLKKNSPKEGEGKRRKVKNVMTGYIAIPEKSLGLAEAEFLTLQVVTNSETSGETSEISSHTQATFHCTSHGYLSQSATR